MSCALRLFSARPPQGSHVVELFNGDKLSRTAPTPLVPHTGRYNETRDGTGHGHGTGVISHSRSVLVLS